jgi:hypothetical protein
MNISFIWDPAKSKTNYEKHGISFQEARSVFYDENAIEFYDEEHSGNEDRYLMLGISDKFRVLLVSYTTRKSDNIIIIRIISARKTTKKEITNYKG